MKSVRACMRLHTLHVFSTSNRFRFALILWLILWSELIRSYYRIYPRDYLNAGERTLQPFICTATAAAAYSRLALKYLHFKWNIFLLIAKYSGMLHCLRIAPRYLPILSTGQHPHLLRLLVQAPPHLPFGRIAKRRSKYIKSEEFEPPLRVNRSKTIDTAVAHILRSLSRSRSLVHAAMSISANRNRLIQSGICASTAAGVAHIDGRQIGSLLAR